MAASVELRAGSARVTLAPEAGGSVASFGWNGRAVLRETRAATLARGEVRDFASYPLVPFSNRIAGATLHWQGATYPLPHYLAGHPHAIHGNGWQRPWDLVQRSPDRATIELVHDASGARGAEWPFPYRARQAFLLTDDVLTLTMTIENIGREAFPFGLGWHPFFPRNRATLLMFRATGVWQTDATQMPTRLDPIPTAWDFSTPRAMGGTTLDHCFVGWTSPATLSWPDRGVAVSIAADPACGHLVVYVPHASDYLAVEPVTHMTDAVNRADAGERDTGTRVLAPAETFSCTMRLSVSLL
jgi:aldose 1-epimerase